MKTIDNRKIVLVGTGFVGMSMAYSFLTKAGIDELVLVDVAKEKAEGEAMDMQHGLPYASSKMKIKAGDYSDCSDASIIVITAGAAQKTGQTRLELTAINTKIMKSIYGHWSWKRRAILVRYNGHVYAASMNGMPHGTQTITGNNFDGHFCIHFYGSKTHGSKKVDAMHQKCVKEAMKCSW